MNSPSRFSKFVVKARDIYKYVTEGVWADTRQSMWVRIVKTCNLSVKSFLDRDLQYRSMSLTYNTVLSIVPALALLFAICRGFGFQNLVEKELYVYLPSQTKAIATGMSFVDSYLQQTSQGIFVGVGILFLLWTLISLLSSIEDTFNMIWDVHQQRSIYRKMTDYIAICLIIPVMLICSSGISIFMSTTLDTQLHLKFLTPVINVILDLAPLLLVWIAFTLSFGLIPNTKVNIKYAAISGGICAVLFQILQLVFVNGQIYVSKYNAIYGSFAFLPLLLIWLQMSWLILLAGCVLTYSLQNIFTYNFLGDVMTISADYRRKLNIVVMAIIVDREMQGKKPLTVQQISTEYDIPIRLANRICDKLHRAGLTYIVVLGGDKTGLAPAAGCENLTVAEFMRRVDATGKNDFIPNFNNLYAPILKTLDETFEKAYDACNVLKIKDLAIPKAHNQNQAKALSDKS